MRRIIVYPIVVVAGMVSVGVPLWLDLLADVDGALPWMLIAAVAFSSLVLALTAALGIHDGYAKAEKIDALEEALDFHVRIEGANRDTRDALLRELYDRIKGTEGGSPS